MGIFYIDTEYTNGNFYLGDIFEIACLSEDSGYIFHSYINIGCTIPNYVKGLCNVPDEKIKSSPSFYEVMNGVIEFINAHESQPPIKIISHGGYLSHFPLLFTNCMRNRFDYTWFEKCEFIDSVKELQQLGYRKPGLDSFAPPHRIHSAAGDVELLREISNKLLRSQNLNVYTLEDIIQYIHTKMPISIVELQVVANTKTFQHLEALLHELAAANTALNTKQVEKIARYYFNYRR